MKKLIITIGLLTILFSIASASSIKDSFLRLIADPDISLIIKAEVTNKLGGFFISNNRDSAEYYTALCMDYALESKDEFQIIDAKLLFVTLEKDNWGLDSTVNYYKQLLSDQFVIKNITLHKTILNDLGVLYGDNGDQQAAIEYAIKALELSRVMGDSLEIGRSIANIGVGYFNMSLNELALEKFKEGAAIFKAVNHKSFESYCYTGIVGVFDNIGEIDSALHYAKHLKSLANDVSLDQYKVEAMISMGQILITKGQYQEAYDEFLEAKSIFETIGDDLSTAYCYCNLGAAKYYLEDYNEALSYYEKALSFDIYQDNHLATQACAKELAYTYQKLGYDKKAFEYLNDYVLYQDTVLLKENKEVIASIEAKYNTAQKENELKSKEAEINQKTYQRNLLFGGLGLSVLLGSSFIWGLFSRNNRNKKIAIQAQDLNHQKIQTLEQEKKLLSMSSLLEGQETERIRIAKDLHDGLGGLLTTVKAHFGQIQSEIEKVENLDIYKRANEMIDKAHDEVRRISHGLMPADLRAGGLPVAVRQQVHELKTVHEMDTDFELVGFNGTRLDEKVELASHRIIQELINNLLKYANSEKVFIQLSKFENEIQIIVEDDGVGFDYEAELKSGKGLGLKSILSRVTQLNGEMDVVTGSGKGTSVTINIPL